MTALISTIASTTTQPIRSSLEAAAEEVCSSLVKHYSDPIHQTPDHDEKGEELPYFHDGSLPCLPPVCQFWHRKLLEVADSDVESVTRELLYCYESVIRPVLINNSNSVGGRMKIIEHYELLLGYYVQNPVENGESEITTSYNMDEVVKRFDDIDLCDNNNENRTTLELGRIIHSVAEDISDWTSKITHNDMETAKKIQNGILPYLLRLLEHCVTLLLSFSHSSNVASRSGNVAKIKTDLTPCKEALSIATVICVPFVGDGRLKSGKFSIGTLMEWICQSNADVTNCNLLSLTAALKCCSPSPFSVMNDSDLMSSSPFMQRPVVGWSALSAQFDAPWSDGVDGIGFRAAVRLLKQIYTSSTNLALSRGKINSVNCNENADILPLLQGIGCNVGIDVLTSTARAFFYGRLTYPSTSSSVSDVASKTIGPYMPMIRRIGTEKREPENEKSDTRSGELSKECNKLRLSAASLICCAVLHKHSFVFEACSDAIPIALTLLDDVHSFYQGLGAIIFLSVIESLSSFGVDTKISSFVAQFNPFLTSAFEAAIKQCGRDEAPLITTICFAQRKWIQYLFSHSQHPDCLVSPEIVKALARKAAVDMLHAVINQARFGGRDGNDERIVGMLVAGINPLLAMLTELPDAAAVEIARVGLSAVLPLIGWRGSSLESHAIHITSIACLLSLINGAYPIMPKHGGKILTEILLLLDRIDKQKDFHLESDDHKSAANVSVQVALFCGAVALIVCGKSAEAAVQHVKSTSLEKPIDRCREVCDLANKLRCL